MTGDRGAFGRSVVSRAVPLVGGPSSDPLPLRDSHCVTTFLQSRRRRKGKGLRPTFWNLETSPPSAFPIQLSTLDIANWEEGKG